MPYSFSKKHASLLSALISLTLLCVAAQILFFIIHYNAADLLDSIVAHSFAKQLVHFSILLPLCGFFLIQLGSYVLLIAWIWYLAQASGKLLGFSRFSIYLTGIGLWTITWTAIFCFNSYYYPHSFFALPFSPLICLFLGMFCIALLFVAAFLAYIYFFFYKKYRKWGSLFLFLGFIFILFSMDEVFTPSPVKSFHPHAPNIILIGLDSLRPDFTGYFGNKNIHTPHIDNFLKSSVTFTDAYTPLARTFPAWISILTAKYPKHSHARNNLTDLTPILTQDTLAKKLQRAGYLTLYATDEKRFSNITSSLGFNKVIGPSMGVNDFLLGSLGDFPLINLLINTKLGRILFPFHYGNRAAAITYEPDRFLDLIKREPLLLRQDSPLFLAIHLCLPHWPYTWAKDHPGENLTARERYQYSVEEVDKQLGKLLKILKERGLLNNSLIVLLSDHGTGLGLIGDRVTEKKYYHGDKEKIKWLPLFHLAQQAHLIIPEARLDTTYGQGTDVLSLQQHHVLLAFHVQDKKIIPHAVNNRSLLLDIAPTILDYLQLKPMQPVDGVSLKPFLFSQHFFVSRPLLWESGYSMVDIETDKININKVVANNIGGYYINPKTALLSVIPSIEQRSLKDKQRAILFGDWLLAHYPAKKAYKLIPTAAHTLVFEPFFIPDYFVLVNLKTKTWSILSKEISPHELLKKFYAFYGDEM